MVVALVVLAAILVAAGTAPVMRRPPPGPLPFDMPAAATVAASPHLVFAHYFPPYPISLDNRAAAEDYYTREYLAPDGEQGRHAAYGGLLRDRPLPRTVSSVADWELQDLETEVRRAVTAGIDGFTVDLLGLEDSDYWSTVVELLRAAHEVDPRFRIILMPDATSPAVADPAALAAAVAGLSSTYPSLFRLADGRLVVSPFAPENAGAAWWSGWVDLMRTRYGIDVALVPCFVQQDPDTASAFASFSYGLSDWGDRSPALNQDLSAPMALAHAWGRIWMQPVSLQDQRPDQQVYDEAENTANLRQTWTAAIDGADWVQLATWNDYSEGSEIAPSAHLGRSPLDISSYYATRFKTGVWPAVVHDVIYLSHRVQFARARPSAQPLPMRLRDGSSSPRDDVEVLAFLTAPATVAIEVGGSTYRFRVGAGVHAVTAPLGAGEVSARVLRGAEVVTAVESPFRVVSSPVVQDEGYYFVGSGREGYRSLLG